MQNNKKEDSTFTKFIIMGWVTFRAFGVPVTFGNNVQLEFILEQERLFY